MLRRPRRWWFFVKKKKDVIFPVDINGLAVEIVKNDKYFGTVIDKRLTFEHQIDQVCKKAHQRMYLYRKLRHFNVDSTFMKMFYSCFI